MASYFREDFEIMIEEETDKKRKEVLRQLYEKHKLDAELCQDFMFWMFQRSYA